MGLLNLGYKNTLIIIFICVCLVLVNNFLINRKGPPEPSYEIPRHIEYSYTIQNKTNKPAEDVFFWTYAPINLTATQKCENIESNHPYKLIEDRLGNRILQFSIDKLPPFSTKIIKIKADMMLSDNPNPIVGDDHDLFLKNEKYCEVDSTEIKKVARNLRDKNNIDTATKIYEWVSSNIIYSGYQRNTRGALYALNKKKGDCTEYMYLFMALCRTNNIPAMGIGGYVTERDTVLSPNNYHNWAEFCSDKTWHIADPQKRVIMETPSRYIAMQVIGKASGNPIGGNSRFRVKGVGVVARMNT